MNLQDLNADHKLNIFRVKSYLRIDVLSGTREENYVKYLKVTHEM